VPIPNLLKAKSLRPNCDPPEVPPILVKLESHFDGTRQKAPATIDNSRFRTLGIPLNSHPTPRPEVFLAVHSATEPANGNSKGVLPVLLLALCPGEQDRNLHLDSRAAPLCNELAHPGAVLDAYCRTLSCTVKALRLAPLLAAC
jgi:hypothetical protein